MHNKTFDKYAIFSQTPIANYTPFTNFGNS